MSHWTPEATILADGEWRRGRIRIEGGLIAAIDALEPVAEEDVPGPFLVPGFVDCHVHGGGGADAMDGEAAVRALARFHAAHGTTTLLPTTMTAPADAIEAALAGIRAVRDRPGEGEAAVAGAHLEGPFINPGKLGCQPPHTLLPDLDLASRWHADHGFAVATIAPELAGGLDFVSGLAGLGVRVQIAHSLATADEAREALASGAAGFTHLFNAMSGMEHRRPGVAAAALAYGVHAEMILDLDHVSPPVVLAALRAVPRLYAVTDATAAAGMPDGRYRIGEVPVDKRGERVVTLDGRTLAGSALTMDRALQNLVTLGLSLDAASELTSTRAADYLGLFDRGRIAKGLRADLVLLDADLEVARVWVGGAPVPDRDGPD